MISVIIPTLNESATIAKIVAFAWNSPGVTEVIVVDDGSIDGTPEIAREGGATVVTSTLLGKGVSLEDGVWSARNDIIVFLDGDLTDLRDDVISRMIEPVAEGRADFVKAKFTRRAGRVTLLTAKPLLRAFFPELAHFEQPLGGIVAARRSLLRRVRFENDYGVDIGLLLDVGALNAPMAEVDIGHLEHKSHSLSALADMAGQVVRTLLDRAARYGRLHASQLREVREAERLRQGDLAELRRAVAGGQQLALFDMDGTLLNGRFVVTLARRTSRTAELMPLLDNDTRDAEERTRRIAALFAGVAREVFEETARNMPLHRGAVETVVGLRKLGYRVGIVTDSYHVASEVVRRRVFADFSVAHLLHFRHGNSTGEITLSPSMFHPAGCAEHDYCKDNVMEHLTEQMGIGRSQVLAVGDGVNDICMLRGAGMSFAYRPKTAAVKHAAGQVVLDSLEDILDLVTRGAVVSASA